MRPKVKYSFKKIAIPFPRCNWGLPSHKVLWSIVTTVHIYGTAKGTRPGHFHELNDGLDSPQVVRKLSQSCYPSKLSDFFLCAARIVLFVAIESLVPLLLLCVWSLLSRYSFAESLFQSKHEIVGEAERGDIDVRCGGQVDIEQIALDQVELILYFFNIECLPCGIKMRGGIAIPARWLLLSTKPFRQRLFGPEG